MFVRVAAAALLAAAPAAAQRTDPLAGLVGEWRSVAPGQRTQGSGHRLVVTRNQLQWQVHSEWIREARFENGAVLIVTNFGPRYSFELLDRDRMCLVAPVPPGVVPVPRGEGDRIPVECFERVRA